MATDARKVARGNSASLSLEPKTRSGITRGKNGVMTDVPEGDFHEIENITVAAGEIV